MTDLKRLGELLAKGNTIRQSAIELGRSYHAVAHVMWRHRIPAYPKARYWTEEEEEFVLKHPYMDTDDMAKALNRTYRSVQRKRHKLRVAKPPGGYNPSGYTMSEAAMLRSLDME